MKKIRFIFLIILVLFVTGCSANYDLNIDRDIIDEKLTFIMNKDEFNKNYDTLSADKSVFDSGDIYYDLDILEDKDSYIITYSYVFNHDDYFNSLNLNSCFDSIDHNIDNNIETFRLEGFNCLQGDNLRVIVNSKYKIINSNASSINGNKNIWDINNSDSIIAFSVDYNKKYFNIDLVYLIISSVVLIILIILLIKRRKRV